MLPTFILEPTPAHKRSAYGRALTAPRASPFPELEEFRARLKELRRAAINGLDSLAARLAETLGRLPRVEVVTAGDTQQAIAAIQQACGTTRAIAINQSSVVAQELAPGLRRAAFRVIDSYYAEFSAFENRFTDYYQLPRGTADYLVESFSTSNLANLRNASIETSGVKDFVSLLGVNAISATDATIFFVQHFHNISKTFQQARKLVLVVGLDKIVPGPEEARLQALSMGIFGWEVRLLRLGSRGGETGLDALPFIPSSQADPDVLVIVMDNGRRRLLDGLYQDLLTCIGCRACIRSCPTQQYFGADAGWSPKEYLYYFVQRRNPSLDLCLNCGMCRVECPLDIDLPGMIIRARSQQRVRRSPASTILSNFEIMARWGSQAPGIANLALGHSLSRWFADKTLGISKDVPMPTFRSDTLARWLKARHGSKEE